MTGALDTLRSRPTLSTHDRCLILLSGGVDSATLAFWISKRGHITECLYLDYGQGQENRERECARSVANRLGVNLTILEAPLPSDLLGCIPPIRANNGGLFGDVVNMCVMATACALNSGAESIAIGVNAYDVQLYPALQRSFFGAIERLSILWIGKRIKILTPFLRKDKSSIARIGARLGVPFEDTWSCSMNVHRHCGICPDCAARRDALSKAGLTDGTEYEH